MNNNIVLLTDSTCDLTPELLERFNIGVIPLYVVINQVTYKDSFEINSKMMYQLSEETKSHPKTATASIQDFYDFFTKYLKEGKEVIYCGIGKDLSSNYQNLFIVKDLIEEKHPELVEHLHFVDSMNLSTGISLVLIKMAQAIEKGLSVEEVIKVGEEVAPRVHAGFCVPNLTYIHKGGRCSNAAKFLGNLLSIKPMLKVEGGKLNVWKKSIGSYRKALNIMIDDYLENFDASDKDYVFITHSLGDEYVPYIKSKLGDKVEKIAHLEETFAGCVISSHCGPGTIGILYIVNEKKKAKRKKKEKKQDEE